MLQAELDGPYFVVEDPLPVEDIPETSQQPDTPDTQVTASGVIRKFIVGPNSINGGVIAVEVQS